MQLDRLKVNQFRNLVDLDLTFSPSFNVIYGPNGSGKSSLLEAIYFLSYGRSFRTALASRAINYQASHFNIFAETCGKQIVSLGLEKTRHGKTRIKIGGQVEPISELAKLLPLQLISPNSYLLLSGGPKARRQFIDWGVFHVEQNFFSLWQKFQQVLKQRNAALQLNVNSQEINVWDNQFVPLALELTYLRECYIQQLLPIITNLIEKLLDLKGIELIFYSGWQKEKDLASLLAQSLRRDISLGYTQFGPHRADLSIKVHNHPVHEILSRGEQKLLSYTLQIAQGLLLKQSTGKRCMYLFDDLFAELDVTKQLRLTHLLHSIDSQIFLTVIDEAPLQKLNESLKGMSFSLQEGKIILD